MGVHFVVDSQQTYPSGVLVDSVTMTAFGPVFVADCAAIPSEVHEWMDRACAYARKTWNLDARECTMPQLREARDATARVEEDVEIGGEG